MLEHVACFHFLPGVIPPFTTVGERELKNDNAAEKKKNNNDSLFVFFLGHISRGDVSAKFRCLS